MSRAVYRFSPGAADGDASMKDLLGGKGANLAEMSVAGLPVPPGFTITTEVCCRVLDAGGALPAEVWSEVEAALAEVEAQMGMRFGDAVSPLLVSVRSGAAVSMPGMMDTILNLGMSDAVAEGLAARTGNPRFAWDAYRRFLEMFATVALGAERSSFDRAMSALKRERGARTDQDLAADDLRELTTRFKAVYRDQTGSEFPTDPKEQLRLAIGAVFASWKSDRAEKYREVQKIRDLLGTAVNVQAMVFGNMGKTSGTGVCFTRNPSNGKKELYGEYLVDAQGEDVVAGVRTPEPIARLEAVMPAIHAELVGLAEKLENHFCNVQDIEFTVQEGKLFLLQTRHGKRTGHAAVKIAVDLVREGLVDIDRAVYQLVEPAHVDQMLHPAFADVGDYRKGGRVVGTGLAASPGAAVGRLVFHAEDAEAWRERGEPVILARVETSPEDVAGMHAAEGIITSRGGMTSHAAVVARGWGKPCIAGCSEIEVDEEAKTLSNGTIKLVLGDWVSLNGTTGEVVAGKEPLSSALVSEDFKTFFTWVDSVRTMKVRTNADTPADAKQARDLGAEGIGLVRTEHMFFDGERILAIRKMILADRDSTRREALAELLAFQRDDFVGIFREMDGLPVTIRLLDPPLHEFLPREAKQQEEIAKAFGIGLDRLKTRIASLQESNPMLGHRGCRLGITHPEITEMQVRAIAEAAMLAADQNVRVIAEIMVPLVGSTAELVHQKKIVERVWAATTGARAGEIALSIGTMIEVPRAALMAGDIAKEAEFFSFGTNDLTQMTMGFSRDDIASFLGTYVRQGIIADDPFQTIDIAGVGQLVKMGVERGRAARPGMKIGVCGEHGGDPRSVAFFAELGFDYVSCSPYRVPVARLAAAQSELKKSGRGGAKRGEA